MNEKIAIYGGAFNPPTLGHFGVIEQILIQEKVDHIIFTPDGEREDKKYGILPEKRIEMIEVFFEEMIDFGLNISLETYFLKQKNACTTTIEVDDFFKAKNIQEAKHIFGIDVIESMPNWTGNKNNFLEQQLRKIFIDRKGYQIPDMKSFDNFEIFHLNILEISSTTVRQMIKNKLNFQNILTPKVFQFVMDEKLYL